MFYSIPNLRALTAEEVSAPWELKTQTPPDYTLGKVHVIEHCARPDTQHAMLSMYEGMSPNVRVSMEDNPPFKMHGIIVDYDNALPKGALEHVLKNAPCDIMPTHLVTSASKNGRLVWQFEAPLLFSNKEHMKAFLNKLNKQMKLSRWLGGMDTEAFTNFVKYYELGQSWEAVKPDYRVPKNLLELWYFQAAQGITFDTGRTVEFKVPWEDLAKEVDERFPGRWRGPFQEGCRGVRFWDPTADNETAAVVTADGMIAYTGNQAFVSWKQIFGASFVAQYEADAISSVVEDVVYDGQAYWMECDGEWTSWNKEDFTQELRVRGKNGSKKPGQTASEIDMIQNYIKKHKSIVSALPFLFFPRGVIKHNGKKFLNTSTVKALTPAPPYTAEPVSFADGEKYFPFIYLLLANMFSETGDLQDVQLVSFLAWLRHAYVHAHDRDPRPGQAIVIAGPPGKGKTFLSWRIISGILGGHADAASHLVENDRWTERLLESPVMTIDDGSALSDAKSLRAFTNKIKRYTANPEITYEQKYEKAGQVPWFGRIVITCNLDSDSLRILPDMDSSTADKICLFKASDPIIDFKDFRTNNQLVEKELPYFARFLLDWEMPEELVAENKRYGIKSYHHPLLFEESRQQGLGVVLESVQGLMDAHFNSVMHKEEKHWQGTTMKLYAELLELYPSLGREFSHRALAIQLGKAAKADFNIKKIWGQDSQQEWIIGKKVRGELDKCVTESPALGAQ